MFYLFLNIILPYVILINIYNFIFNVNIKKSIENELYLFHVAWVQNRFQV